MAWKFSTTVKSASKEARLKRSSLDKDEVKAIGLPLGFCKASGSIYNEADESECGWIVSHDSGNKFAIFPGQLDEARQAANLKVAEVFSVNEEKYTPRFEAFKLSKEKNSTKFKIELAVTSNTSQDDE